MKPVDYIVKHSSNNLQPIETGHTVGTIIGKVTEIGIPSSKVTVVLYTKSNLSPLAVRRTDELGEYQFLGLNTSLNCFIVAFDSARQFNAVIQDRVIPK